MVRNKHIGGRLNRSSTGKNQKAGSQISSSKDLTPPDKPAEGDIPANSPELQTTSKGQLGFPDRVYLLASFIFQNHHLEKPPAQRLVSYGKRRALSLPRVKDEEMQRTAYELAFNTLKCEFVDDWKSEVCCMFKLLSLLFFPFTVHLSLLCQHGIHIPTHFIHLYCVLEILCSEDISKECSAPSMLIQDSITFRHFNIGDR